MNSRWQLPQCHKRCWRWLYFFCGSDILRRPSFAADIVANLCQLEFLSSNHLSQESAKTPAVAIINRGCVSETRDSLSHRQNAHPRGTAVYSRGSRAPRASYRRSRTRRTKARKYKECRTLFSLWLIMKSVDSRSIEPRP